MSPALSQAGLTPAQTGCEGRLLPFQQGSTVYIKQIGGSSPAPMSTQTPETTTPIGNLDGSLRRKAKD